MAKDTKTRYQGVYARHKTGCRVERGGRCACKPSYWGKVYDRDSGKPRYTAFLATLAAARNARDDLRRDLRHGRLPRANRCDSHRRRRRFFARHEMASRRTNTDAATSPQRFATLTARFSTMSSRRSAPSGSATFDAGTFSGWSMNWRSADREAVCAPWSIRSTPCTGGLKLANSFITTRLALVQLPAMGSQPRDRVASVEEMRGLLEALDLEDALPYAIAVYATARRDEIRHLRVEDIDVKVGVVYLGADEAGRKSRSAQRAVPSCARSVRRFADH